MSPGERGLRVKGSAGESCKSTQGKGALRWIWEIPTAERQLHIPLVSK